jgi:hypothetical protein
MYYITITKVIQILKEIVQIYYQFSYKNSQSWEKKWEHLNTQHVIFEENTTSKA